MFKVFVGNLDSRVTADTLRPLFEPFGDLDEIIVAIDPETKRSRGFAIVLFRDALKGQLAIETLAGRKVNGRTLIINEALKKGKAPQGAPGKPPRQGPFGPRFGAARGGVGARRFSSRNPRRGATGAGGSGPPGARSPGPVAPIPPRSPAPPSSPHGSEGGSSPPSATPPSSRKPPESPTQ